MLKLAFPNIEDLQNTLLQDRLKLNVTRSIVQVIHIKGQHWAVLSNISCQDAGNNDICIYDSFYNDIDDRTAKLINNMTHGKIHSSHVHSKLKKEGGTDCGVFAIAIATSLLYNQSPLKFQQPQMRHHLILCFENNSLVPFP
uniref:Ubiquitin-like protease family profile domain-containing protein n=1 Tax=Amphimedon queenslandica TaxID=400682 RepID=A0A1X7UDU7_AMPQE